MNIVDQTGGEPPSERPLVPQKTVVEEIQRVVRHGYRRLMVLGPPGSKRLGAVNRALGPAGIILAVIDLAAVRTRADLDLAVKRATRGADFYGGMRRLIRQAQHRRLAIVFHNFDGCSGSDGEEFVRYRVWFEARNHCGSAIFVFTATDPAFVARCFGQFPNCRTFVYPVDLQERATVGGHTIAATERRSA